MKLYLPAIAALVVICSGCTRQIPTADPYFAGMLENTTYYQRTPELDRNSRIPGYNPKDIKRLFDQNKVRIVGAIARYLRTYDGAEYPQIGIAVNGEPLPPNGAQVVFHTSVRATVAPREGGGVRPLLDDSYRGRLFFSVTKNRIVRIEFNGDHLSTVRRKELDRALALAAQLDSRYDSSALHDARWLPRWYVAEYIVPRQRAGESVPEEYSFIRRKTKGHVVILPFVFFGERDSDWYAPYHVVSVDMAAGRVLGVYKGTIYVGPMYGQ